MMQKRRFWVALVLVGMICLLGAFSLVQLVAPTENSPKETIKLMWWGTNERNENYIQAIDLFEAENPTIKVEYEYYSWDDYWQRLSTMAVSDDLPDVFQMDLTYLAQFGLDDYLLDLGDLVAAEKIQTRAIEPELLNSGKIGQHLYGLTASVNTMANIINPDLLQQAQIPQTFLDGQYSFTEWVQILRQIKAKTDHFGYVENEDVFVPLQYFLQTKGENLFRYVDGKPRSGFSEKNFLTYFETMADLVQTGVSAGEDQVQQYKSMDENPLTNGQAAFYQGWVQMYDWFESAARRQQQQLLISPPYASGVQTEWAYHPAIQYSISRASKHSTAAAKLLDFLINDQPAAKKYFGIERGLPANQEVQQTLANSLSPNQKQIISYMTTAKKAQTKSYTLPPKGMIEINQVLNQVYLETISGKITPAEALATYQTKFQQVIDQNYPAERE